ncbi:SGNH/GDSL hydrolase family protein [Streptomyces sp. CB01881]|uniref:SGNH/GDSL hydrolase family protein n=1 Tax=Streptomyces sp. CB01881 TaxID=2078691 RepID=UPI000CDBC1E4|nr:SGNH/GDSL hydrolase family protein [Streptomyces sp. CB01881]AUY52344.1 GDSL family lipase [Streptomyces sp. CB01881]TYC71767.1 SGNH/GDSL hydrolase family protein [Streptomyces sp. CB01881]
MENTAEKSAPSVPTTPTGEPIPAAPSGRTGRTGYAGYVAVGDSFTEGMCDELLPDGHYRGWADRVADRLAAEQPAGAFRYANLAVRGKLIGQIHDEQVPAATAMGAELVTLAGGLNDVLRPRCDIARVEELLGRSAAALRAGGATVVMFTSTDPTRRMAGSARLLPAILRMKAFVHELGQDPGIAVVDLFSAPCFDDRRLWAEDRLHLSPEGHRRVAEAVLESLGRPATFDWRAPLPAAAPRGRSEKLAADARWARTHLGPWLGRRLTGRSSGDGRPPKRAELLPYEPSDR